MPCGGKRFSGFRMTPGGKAPAGSWIPGEAGCANPFSPGGGGACCGQAAVWKDLSDAKRACFVLLRRKTKRIGRPTSRCHYLSDEEGRPHQTGRIAKNLFCGGNTMQGRDDNVLLNSRTDPSPWRLPCGGKRFSGFRMTPGERRWAEGGFGRQVRKAGCIMIR